MHSAFTIHIWENLSQTFKWNMDNCVTGSIGFLCILVSRKQANEKKRRNMNQEWLRLTRRRVLSKLERMKAIRAERKENAAGCAFRARLSLLKRVARGCAARDCACHACAPSGSRQSLRWRQSWRRKHTRTLLPPPPPPPVGASTPLPPRLRHRHRRRSRDSWVSTLTLHAPISLHSHVHEVARTGQAASSLSLSFASPARIPCSVILCLAFAPSLSLSPFLYLFIVSLSLSFTWLLTRAVHYTSHTGVIPIASRGTGRGHRSCGWG